MHKLAIVIPYYKIDFFAKTLESIAAQTDNRFTLYIGNDASPNNPQNLISEYFPNENYFYYDYKENIGGRNLALQWERIIDNVSEEWFQILGDDDSIDENFVEQFYKIIDGLPNDINLIRVNNKYVNDKGEVYREGKEFPEIHTSKDLFNNKLHYKTASTLSENIFRKAGYEKYKFKLYPIAWHSDDMLILEITQFGNYYFNKNTGVRIYNGQKNLSGDTSNVTEKFEASQDFFLDLLHDYKIHLDKDIVNRYLGNLKLTAKAHQQKFTINLITQLLKNGYASTSLALFKFNYYKK